MRKELLLKELKNRIRSLEEKRRTAQKNLQKELDEKRELLQDVKLKTLVANKALDESLTKQQYAAKQSQHFLSEVEEGKKKLEDQGKRLKNISDEEKKVSEDLSSSKELRDELLSDIEFKQRSILDVNAEANEKSEILQDLVEKIEPLKEEFKELEGSVTSLTLSNNDLNELLTLRKGQLTEIENKLSKSSLEALYYSEIGLPGIYLVSPHGEMIWRKRKTAIVKSKYFKSAVNVDLVLVEEKKAYGIIRLSQPKKIGVRDFKRFQRYHRVTDEERRKWWPDKKTFFFYTFKDFYPFEKPKAVEVPRGVQTFIRNVKFVKDNIEDITTYNPRKANDKQLADDWRIACAWYSRMKEGLKFKFTEQEVVELATKIHQEMKRRGFVFHPGKMKKWSRALFEKVQRQIKDKSMFAPIHVSESPRKGRQITLKEVLTAWEKPMILVEDFVTLVGSVANHGATRGDLDIILRKDEPDSPMEDTPLKFRLARAFQDPEVRNKLHFLYDTYHGPFTSHTHIYDLALIPSCERLEVHDMAVMIPDFRKQQGISKNENKIKPFRAFWQQKPQHGRRVAEPYTLETTLQVINDTWKDWKEKGILVGKKCDGATIQIHHVGDKIVVWTEDGHDVTDNVISVVTEAKEIKGDWIAIGELEWYKDGKHQPRADTAGIINSSKPIEAGKDIRLTLYDVFFWEGKDIHKSPYVERHKLLSKLTPSDHLKIQKDEPKVHSEKELLEVSRKKAKEEGSEGVMYKLATGIYELEKTPYPPSMVKFKTEYQVIARVKGVEPIEGAQAWVYVVAIDEDKIERENV